MIYRITETDGKEQIERLIEYPEISFEAYNCTETERKTAFGIIEGWAYVAKMGDILSFSLNQRLYVIHIEQEANR